MQPLAPREDSSDLVTPGDLAHLADLHIWPQDAYRDLRRVGAGDLSEADFTAKYVRRGAIVVIDTCGLTSTTSRLGPVRSMLRVMWFHEACMPVLRAHGAQWMSGHADNIAARFDTAPTALRAALALHGAIATHRANGIDAPEICIGIGYGDMLVIGEHTSWGSEMNYASKLGEDTAEAGETLLTDTAHTHVRDVEGIRYEHITSADAPHSYWSALPAT